MTDCDKGKAGTIHPECVGEKHYSDDHGTGSARKMAKAPDVDLEKDEGGVMPDTTVANALEKAKFGKDEFGQQKAGYQTKKQRLESKAQHDTALATPSDESTTVGRVRRILSEQGYDFPEDMLRNKIMEILAADSSGVPTRSMKPATADAIRNAHKQAEQELGDEKQAEEDAKAKALDDAKPNITAFDNQMKVSESRGAADPAMVSEEHRYKVDPKEVTLTVGGTHAPVGGAPKDPGYHVSQVGEGETQATPPQIGTEEDYNPALKKGHGIPSFEELAKSAEARNAEQRGICSGMRTIGYNFKGQSIPIQNGYRQVFLQRDVPAMPSVDDMKVTKN